MFYMGYFVQTSIWCEQMVKN